MQAIILAAGKSTRTYPLTLTKPKPLLKVLNKPILEYLLDAMVECGVEESIIIVGYMKDKIISHFGDSYRGMKLTYIEQKEQIGVLHAVHLAKDIIKGRFMVLYGDDILHSDDLKRGLRHKYSLLAYETKTPERFGIAVLNKEGYLENLIEKPKEYIGNLASVGGFVFDRKIFDYPLELEPGQSEYFIPTMLRKLCKEEKVALLKVEKYWLPTGYPWDLLAANELLIKGIKAKIDGVVEHGAVLKEAVIIGKGSVVKAGAYIEGPVVIGENCTIGPNCYLRAGTAIGNNCKVGNAVEIKNSILMDGVHVGHLSYIGDSILGEKANIGAGTITANLRHDNGNVRSMSKGVLVDTGRRKLGVIMGDNVHTGINTSIYPGRKIYPNKSTIPGEIVRKDIE